MAETEVMDYQGALQRKILIGIATGLGSMLIVGVVVLTLLILYRNHHRKKKASDTESNRRDSRRPTTSSQPPRPPPGSASSVSSDSDVVAPKDVRLSVDNFSFGNVSLSQNEDLAVRLENELDHDRNQRASRNRYPSGSYSAGISHLLDNPASNYRHNDAMAGPRRNSNMSNMMYNHQAVNTRRDGYSRDYNHYPPQHPNRHDLPDSHFVRSISADPYIHPHDRLDDQIVRTSHRSHSLDAERHLQDAMTSPTPASRILSHIVPKTMPSRTRNLARDSYFGDDVNYDGNQDGRRFERSDLAAELTGYFDSPLNKRSEPRNGNVKLNDDYIGHSEFSQRNQELWTQRFDYTEFNRLPRIPLSFSGNRRFLTEHPQRSMFRPM